MKNIEDADLFFGLYVGSSLFHVLLSLKLSKAYYALAMDTTKCWNLAKVLISLCIFACSLWYIAFLNQAAPASGLIEHLIFVMNLLYSATFYFDMKELNDKFLRSLADYETPHTV